MTTPEEPVGRAYAERNAKLGRHEYESPSENQERHEQGAAIKRELSVAFAKWLDQTAYPFDEVRARLYAIGFSEDDALEMCYEALAAVLENGPDEFLQG